MKNKRSKYVMVLLLIILMGCTAKEEKEIQFYQCDYEYNNKENVISTITLKTEGKYVKRYRKTDKINVTEANYTDQELEKAKQDIIQNVYSVSEGKGITVDGKIIKEKNTVFIEYYIEADLEKADIQLLRYSNLVDDFDKENNTLTTDQLKSFFETNDFVCELIEKKEG